MRTRFLAAIIAFGCHSIRIAGNLVDQARMANRLGSFAIGIASDLGFTQLDVTENTVDQMSKETQPRDDPQNLAGSIALLVEDIPGDDSPMLVDSGATRFLVTTNAIYAHAINLRSRSTTSVRGNKLNGAGDNPAVVVGLVNEKLDRDISSFGPLTFAENFCELDGRGIQPTSRPVAVTLAAQALALPDNQVRQPWGGDGLAVRALVGFAGHDLAVTATGNITDGDIEVNGPVLQPPWQPLNIRLS
ncbi:MAG: hypothetical protein L0221_15510 [Chloroflexi bacterium]|nr:hypothetical protein [Chloroflexota bacterium]